MSIITINTEKERSISIPEGTKVLKYNLNKPLPKLNEGLEILVCNNVLYLPDVLPSTLVELVCNSAVSLPEKLPKGLKVLRCNTLTEIENNLPSTLEALECDSVLRILCSLPDSIKRFSCNGINKITFDLPKKLRVLKIDSVTNLDFTILPKTLIALHCNKVTDVNLSKLSKLEEVSCVSATCLETLPKSVKEVVCNTDSIIPSKVKDVNFIKMTTSMRERYIDLVAA